MSVKKRDRLLSGPGAILLMAVILVACILLSFLFGRYPVPFRELCGILANKFLSIFGLGIEPFWTDAMQAAVWNVRLPRVIMSVLVGACLSAAGAGFGAALAIYVGLSSMYITFAAFGMSLLTVVLVFWVSRHAKGERVLGLVLAGIMVSSLFQAGTSFIKLAADPTNKLPEITYWLMGSLSGMAWEDLGFVIWPMLLGMVPLFLLRWRLNVLAMGDDEARAMGVDAGRLRIWLIVAATLVTASSVSVSGMIGWVGLVIPHMVRRICGSDYRWLMPCCMLGGGIFLLIVDNVSRNVTTAGIPIGILTAFIGAPFFLWLITGRGERL